MDSTGSYSGWNIDWLLELLTLLFEVTGQAAIFAVHFKVSNAMWCLLWLLVHKLCNGCEGKLVV